MLSTRSWDGTCDASSARSITLNGDMGGFASMLQRIALARESRAVVVLERALDLDGMRVVTFNKIAVVAIHGTHQVSERATDAFRQTSPESAADLAARLYGQIGEASPLAPAWSRR